MSDDKKPLAPPERTPEWRQNPANAAVESMIASGALVYESAAPQEPAVTQDGESFGLSLEEGLAQMESVAIEYLAVKILAANWVKWDLRDTVGGYPLGTTMTIAQREIIHNALRYYALKEQHEADARIAAIVREPSDEQAYQLSQRIGPSWNTSTREYSQMHGRRACRAIISVAETGCKESR